MILLAASDGLRTRSEGGAAGRGHYDAFEDLHALTSLSWAIDSDVTETQSPEEEAMTNQTPAPIDLTAFEDTIGNAFGDGTPTLWATASKDGLPDLAPKGSTMVWDKDHLAFWERAHGTMLENLRENPHAAMFYRNRDRGVGARRFFGTAELYATGEIREAVRSRTVQAELDRDPDNKGVAVVVRIDRVADGSKDVQLRS